MSPNVIFNPKFFQDDPRRKVFLEKITRIMSKLIQYAPVDGAADQVN